MKIVIGAHTPIGAPLTIGSHHYAKKLAELGHDVQHIPYPVTPFDLLTNNIYNYGKLIIKSLIRKERLVPDFFRHANLKQIYYFSLLPRKLLPNNKFGDWFYQKCILSFNRKECDVIIIDHPLQLWLLNFYKTKKIIYRLTDIYVFEGAHNKQLLQRLEKRLLAIVDGLIVTSPVILESLDITHKINHKKIPFLYLSNGVDYEHYVNENKLKDRDDTAVFIGAVDFRFDHELLIYLAKQFKQIDFKIIGKVTQDFLDSVSSFDNIICTGNIPYVELSSELAKCKIGLLLASKSKINAGRSPMKIYEYGAAGLPVVSTSTPEIESRNEPFIFTYKTKEDACLAMNNILDNFDEISMKAVDASKKHSWNGKTIELINFINKLS